MRATQPEAIRAAVYARFSTEHQNERSTDDQIDLCKGYAKREGFAVVATYADKAISGASIHGRYDFQRMIQDAHAEKFDVIVVEAMDRLSRSLADLATLYDQLSFKGVRIFAVNEGEANTINVALRGLVAQLFREDNVHKVRRGMTGLIKQGLTAGGKAYGYKPDPANRGKPVIVESEATIVRRIFEDYAKGVSPKAICKRLNAEFVKPPRGKLWSPSTFHGSASRGTGMLRNPMYVGRIVWNKVHMVKDPNSERQGNIGILKRPKYLLSGLLKCGSCGSGMSRMGDDKSGRTRIRCSAHTNSGACADPKTFYADEVENLVISSLTQELSSPDQIRVYAERYIKARVARSAHENRRHAEIEARIAGIAKDNDQLLGLLMKGMGDQDAIDARMKVQGRERDDLKHELARLPRGSNIICTRPPSSRWPTS